MTHTLYFKYLDEKCDAILICNQNPCSTDYKVLSFNSEKATTLMKQKYPALCSSDIAREIKTSILDLAKNTRDISCDLHITEDKRSRSFGTWLHHQHMNIVYTITFNSRSIPSLLREIRDLSSEYKIDNWRALKDLNWSYMGDLLSVCAVKVMSCGFYTHKVTGREFYSKQYEFERSPKVVFTASAIVAIAAIFGAVALARSGKIGDFVDFVTGKASDVVGIA